MGIPKSRTRGELIPAVIIEFTTGSPNYYWTEDQWKDIGGYQGFLKSHSMSVLDIMKVHRRLLNPNDFPTDAWEG